MAATKGIRAPVTPAFEVAREGGDQDPAAEQPIGPCCKAVPCVFAVLMLAISLFAMGGLFYLVAFDGYPTEYSAAITDITGAAAAPDNSKHAPPPMSAAVPAMFNLTVRIKNPSRLYARCVWSDATALVSYGGVTIGAGTVPWFCAGMMEEREATVPVWGVGAGADVALPRALRSRGAVVDVEVRMPRSERCRQPYQHVLSCSVKVGGCLSPCTSSCV